MRWRISNAKGSGTDFIGDAEGTPISQAAQELWRKYIDDAAPKNAEIAWDHLRVEVWLDSGRVILFPTPSPFRYRVEKAMCQIVCPDLLASYDEVVDSDMPDDEFNTWAEAATSKVASLVSNAAREVRLPERLDRPEIKILYYGADLENPIRQDMLKA